MASKYAYRTEDAFTQSILERCLEHYQSTKLFDITALETMIIQKELAKLQRLSRKRIDEQADTSLPEPL